MFLYTNYVLTDDRECAARPQARDRARPARARGHSVPSLVPAEGRGEQAEFIRNQYYGLEWRAGVGECGAGAGAGEAAGAGALVTDADLYCELVLQRAGSFHYYYVYDTA